MIEAIGIAKAMQPKAIQSGQSVISAGNAKMQEVSEKKLSVVQTDGSRKRDRFEHSNKSLYAKPADNKSTQEEPEKERNAAQANKQRSFDRLEFSSEYLAVSSAKSENGKKSPNLSGTDMYTVKSDKSSKGEKPVNSSQETAAQNENTSAQGISSDDSSESVSSNDLYKYTDSELKDLLLDGSITRNEYNREIAKREN